MPTVPQTIDQHEGVKYLRTIYSCLPNPKGGDVPESIAVDVYAVLVAFRVHEVGAASGPVGHALKKLLCPGVRGKGDLLADLVGAQAALARAIEIVKREVAASTDEGKQAVQPKSDGFY